MGEFSTLSEAFPSRGEGGSRLLLWVSILFKAFFFQGWNIIITPGIFFVPPGVFSVRTYGCTLNTAVVGTWYNRRYLRTAAGAVGATVGAR